MIEVNGKTITITAFLSFFVLTGSAYATFKTLGWDDALPVSRETMEDAVETVERKLYKLAGSVQDEAREKNAYWQSYWRGQLYQNETARSKWQKANPGQPVPGIYEDQRYNIQRTIKQLENQRMFLPPSN